MGGNESISETSHQLDNIQELVPQLMESSEMMEDIIKSLTALKVEYDQMIENRHENDMSEEELFIKLFCVSLGFIKEMVKSKEALENKWQNLWKTNKKF